MTDKHEPSKTVDGSDPVSGGDEKREVQSRRDFLIGLGNWSRAVIVGAVGGAALLSDRPAQAGWLNRRGGGGAGWINGSGGGSWANRRGGGWGGSWVNKR